MTGHHTVESPAESSSDAAARAAAETISTEVDNALTPLFSALSLEAEIETPADVSGVAQPPPGSWDRFPLEIREAIWQYVVEDSVVHRVVNISVEWLPNPSPVVQTSSVFGVIGRFRVTNEDWLRQHDVLYPLMTTCFEFRRFAQRYIKRNPRVASWSPPTRSFTRQWRTAADARVRGTDTEIWVIWDLLVHQLHINPDTDYILINGLDTRDTAVPALAALAQPSTSYPPVAFPGNPYTADPPLTPVSMVDMPLLQFDLQIEDNLSATLWNWAPTNRRSFQFTHDQRIFLDAFANIMFPTTRGLMQNLGMFPYCVLIQPPWDEFLPVHRTITAGVGDLWHGPNIQLADLQISPAFQEFAAGRVEDLTARGRAWEGLRVREGRQAAMMRYILWQWVGELHEQHNRRAPGADPFEIRPVVPVQIPVIIYARIQPAEVETEDA
ncbi:hypothetical protein QBC35DRAFT_478761 [Podospora australis]|uniref:2EXR domain-containing protein n=1 Tax=Podospora australis TaxID=1536484 RepID=A0AAN6WJ74_9PEZI|nr:hypothetical protein QBC35DRAFT_478761 [Podospora australis]